MNCRCGSWCEGSLWPRPPASLGGRAAVVKDWTRRAVAADAPTDFCTTSGGDETESIDCRVPQEELGIGKLSSILPMLSEDDLSISEDRPLLFELVDESNDGFPHSGGIIITLLMRSCLPLSQLSRAAA